MQTFFFAADHKADRAGQIGIVNRFPGFAGKTNAYNAEGFLQFPNCLCKISIFHDRQMICRACA